jgi:NADH-quinone oxidoreductase subunit N
MAIYLIMTLGTFACIIAMRRGTSRSRDRATSQASAHQSGWPSCWRCCCSRWRASRRSPGFFAKWYVFAAAVDAKLYTLAVIGVLSSVGRLLLLPAHRQADVFRRAGPAFVPVRTELKGCWRHGPLFNVAFVIYGRRRLSPPRPRPRASLF